MKNRIRILVLLPLLISALYIAAQGEEVSIQITDYAIINNNSGDFRVLVHILLPDSIADSTLMFAELSFMVSPELEKDGILRINCHAVTTPWNSENVDWDNPWQNPGGDFEQDELTMFTTAANEETPAIFDITDQAKSWLNGSIENNGLVFLIPDEIASRFEIGRLPDFPENALGIIKYTIQ
jgi:hypothetical protein